MDQMFLVENRVSAGEQFLHEFGQEHPIRTAYWLKPYENSNWYLYVALDQFDDQNRRLVHTDVRQATKRLPEDVYFDPFWVRIVRSDDPITQAVLALQEKYAPSMPTIYEGSQLGGVNIEGAFFYRLPTPVS